MTANVIAFAKKHKHRFYNHINVTAVQLLN